jgi:hypothetical protein
VWIQAESQNFPIAGMGEESDGDLKMGDQKREQVFFGTGEPAPCLDFPNP